MSFSRYVRSNATQLRVLIGRLCLSVHSNVRVMSPRHAAGDIVRPTLLRTDEETEKQEKISCRSCTAVVVVALVLDTCICQVVDFASFKICARYVKSGYMHNNIEYVRCTKGSRLKPTRAERTATLTLALWVPLLLLLLLFCCWRSSAVDVVQQ